MLPHLKGALLEPSLSVLLPVYNDQSTLAATVQQILEVLSDTSGRFELVIIDDGSSDATIEVADELASYYPQVSAVRHAKPLGREAAIRTGLERSNGDLVLLRDENGLRRIDRRGIKLGQRSSGDPTARADSPQADPGTPQRPNYLGKLKTFALGE